MNKTHSRHAAATAFILLALCFIAPHAGAVRNFASEAAGPPGPPGPAAVWPTHILPRGDLAVREFDQRTAALEVQRVPSPSEFRGRVINSFLPEHNQPVELGTVSSRLVSCLNLSHPQVALDLRPEFQNLLRSNTPILALAPMQDVTDLRFMRLISGYGNADVYFTEYFRVLPDSRLDPQILALHHAKPDRPPGHRADDRQRHRGPRAHRARAATVSRRGDRSEPRLPRPDRVSQMRRRRFAPRPRSHRPNPGRIARSHRDPVHGENAHRLRRHRRLRRTPSDLRPPFARPAHRPRANGERDVSQRTPIRLHRARRRRDAMPGARERQHLFRRQSRRSPRRSPARADS